MRNKLILTGLVSLLVSSVDCYASDKSDVMSQIEQKLLQQSADIGVDRILELSDFSNLPARKVQPLILNICHQAFLVEKNKILEKRAAEPDETEPSQRHINDMIMVDELISYWAKQVGTISMWKRRIYKRKALKGLAYEFEGRTVRQKNLTIAERCMHISRSRGWSPKPLNR